MQQPITTATNFRFKSNIEFPFLLMLYQARMGGRVRDAPAFNRARTMPEMPSRSNLAVSFNKSTITTRLGAPSHRFAPVRTVSCNTPPGVWHQKGDFHSRQGVARLTG